MKVANFHQCISGLPNVIGCKTIAGLRVVIHASHVHPLLFQSYYNHKVAMEKDTRNENFNYIMLKKLCIKIPHSA